jgi:predicted PurR-regulated permease PerM
VSAADLAALIVAFAAIVAVVVLLFAVVSLVSTLRSLRDTIEAIRIEAIPAVADLRRAAAQANHELDRVDGLLDTAESISTTVDSASRLTYLVVSNPLIKIVAFGVGAGRAAKRLRRKS